MMTIIKNILGVVFGFGEGTSLPNKVAGAANYAFFIPVVTWIWFHRAGEITLQILIHHGEKTETISLFTTTFGGLAVILGGILVYVEFLRRSGASARPGPSLGGAP